MVARSPSGTLRDDRGQDTSTLLNSLQFHDKTMGLETGACGGQGGEIFERLS
jgi:hypothetical protein